MSRQRLQNVAPRGPARVDWKHPLSSGLVGCYVPSTGAYADLTGIGPTLRPDTGSGWGTGQEGVGLTGSGSNTRNYASSIPGAWKFGSGGTLLWRGRFTGASSGACLIGTNYAQTQQAPYVAWALAFADGGGDQVVFYYNDGSGLQRTAQVSASNPSSMAVTFVVGGAVTIYRNGVAIAAGSWPGGPPDYSAGPVFNVAGDSNDPTRAVTGITHAAMLWNRALSADEVARLDATPYAMLKQPSRRLTQAAPLPGLAQMAAPRRPFFVVIS